MSTIDPPFQETFKTLIMKGNSPYNLVRAKQEKPFLMDNHHDQEYCTAGEYELPVVDMSCLSLGHRERQKYMKEICGAASEWGFFQVVNHGISPEFFANIKYEQIKIFHQPFNKKSQDNFLNLPSNTYRWGNPQAISLSQFSWSEAFHISLADISRLDAHNITLRSTIEGFARIAGNLAETLAEILAQNLGVKSNFFRENCTASSSYIRMNRYPSCPFSSQVYGLVPHTDSDFLTILYQDQTGGLQILKDGRWLHVRPNPHSLIINIGDLFQVFSNNVYRSIKHRVIAPQEVERFSVAYFYCPSYDAVIQSYRNPSIYRKFSFREYKQQILQDLQADGEKAGLSRFLL